MTGYLTLVEVLTIHDRMMQEFGGASGPGVFLRMNGLVLDVDDAGAYDVIIGALERGDLDRDLVDAWIREHLTG